MSEKKVDLTSAKQNVGVWLVKVGTLLESLTVLQYSEHNDDSR